MATHCQMSTQSGSGECQNIGVVNSFKGKKGVGGGQLQTVFVFTLFCEVHDVYYIK